MRTGIAILLSLFILAGCSPTKRLERLKAKICPYCVTEAGTSDSTIVFYSDSVYWGDTTIVVDNPLTVEVEHDTTIFRVIFKDKIKTVNRTVLKKVDRYVKGDTVIVKKVPAFAWVFIFGFFLLLLIIVAWFILQLKGGLGAAYKYTKSLFTPKK